MPSRDWLIAAWLLCVCAWISPAQSFAQPPVNAIAGAKPEATWRSDFPAAEAEAKRLGLPLLVHFYADWCGPCQRMEHETLGTLALQKQVSGRFIAVKINSEHQPSLVQRFAVKSLPTDLMLNSDGTVLARSVGYLSQKDYLARLAEVDARLVRARKVHIAGSHGGSAIPKPVVPPVPAVKPDPKPTSVHPEHGILPEIAQEEALPVLKPKWALGLRGFSPVALANQKQWIKGSKEFSAEYKGIVYHMVSESERAEFRAAPHRFAPQLLGCDPVILEETDRALVGDTRFGVFFEGELYFFVNQTNREKFKASPHRFTRTKHVLNLKKIQESELR